MLNILHKIRYPQQKMRGRTALGAMVAGVIAIILNIMGLIRGCTLSTAYGPIVSIVLALLFTYYSTNYILFMRTVDYFLVTVK